MHVYDRTFYNYINAGAIRSAEHILPIVLRHFPIRAVVDFGAGQGAWLSVWKKLGVGDVIAVDGDYVERTSLLVEPAEYVAADLTRQVRLGRTFDLVQSLEVAEHLPESAAETFVDNLVAHGSLVLFSAATPGQGGEHHLNERSYDYWRSLFAKRGFVMLDLIRHGVAHNRSVERWYRYNSFVFVESDRFSSLSGNIRRHCVPDGVPVPDVSPALYRLRKALVRCLLSRSAATRVALAKKHWRTRVSRVWRDA